VVFEFIVTVPDYPRRIVGATTLIELYRGYQNTFFPGKSTLGPAGRGQPTIWVTWDRATQAVTVRACMRGSQRRLCPHEQVAGRTGLRL
jgi:hypothetical protein